MTKVDWFQKTNWINSRFKGGLNMPEITLEKTHALLEKLAEYVMNEVPTKRDVDARFAQVDGRFEQIDRRFALMEQRLDKLELEKADKQDIETILNILDKQTNQLDIIRTEQVAFDHAFRRLEKRLEILESS